MMPKESPRLRQRRQGLFGPATVTVAGIMTVFVET